MLGKLPVPGRPNNLVYSRTRAVGAGVVVWTFLSFLSSFSLSLGDGPM